MTAFRQRRTLLAVVHWGGTVLAGLALAALVAVGQPGAAHAASPTDDYNQMTGIGSTDSALTVKWSQGLLNAQNQPITSDATDLSPDSDRTAYAANPASATSPLSFMYSDFENLQVTVSQTENITHQGITVSWTGGQQSSQGAPLYNFLQMMECYGDSANGPSPEGCEYGSTKMLGSIPNLLITGRTGSLCPAGSVPSTTSPVAGVNAPPYLGCDTNEPVAETPTHCDPSATDPSQTCAGGEFSIPFVPADDPTNPIYGQDNLPKEFDQYNTNEVQAAYTSADGTGQKQFETLTANQAPGLGCGETESNGQTRNCWLVIVPRGIYDPNGYQASNTNLDTTPLSAGNWAQRIQIHLGYAPLNPNCPPTVLPDAMVGTQVVYRAVSSWQTALNQSAQCSRVYSFTASTENEATNELISAASGSGGAGLAFTTIPIGSEVARDGLGSPPTVPTTLYAPVAVTALGFGFNINQAGQVTTPVKLTPSLLAKSLTQVYRSDLPDYYPDLGLPGPAWATGNPLNITNDPAFKTLNPEITTYNSTDSAFPLFVGDLSVDSLRSWQWIQSDAATDSWLDGADTSNPVTADPDAVKLNLGQPSTGNNQFGEDYKGTVTCSQVVTNLSSCGGPPDLSNPTSTSCVIPQGDTANTNTKACLALGSEGMLPVETNYDQAAAAVLAATDSGLTNRWDPTAKAPDGSSGYWVSVGTELPGSTFMWTVNDMPDLAAYGLVSASLCDPAGATCVQPSTDSVSAAFATATADSAGLLQVDPATAAAAGAYPLVDVVYAAVPTNQSATVLSDYADFISYAVGQGQTTGSAPGDLPPGYLPLPASLVTQAQSVAKQLKALAGPTPTASPTSTTSATSTTSTSGTQQQTTTGGSTTTGGTTTGGTTTGGSTTTGGTTTTGGSTTTGGTTTTGGSTRTGGQTSATTSASAHATQSAATSPSSSATPTVPFTVLPGPAQAAAGTTQATTVGSVRDVLIIVLIIGAAGALVGGLLRYGRLPGRGRRSRPG